MRDGALMASRRFPSLLSRHMSESSLAGLGLETRPPLSVVTPIFYIRRCLSRAADTSQLPLRQVSSTSARILDRARPLWLKDTQHGPFAVTRLFANRLDQTDSTILSDSSMIFGR